MLHANLHSKWKHETKAMMQNYMQGVSAHRNEYLKDVTLIFVEAEDYMTLCPNISN